MAAKTGVEGAAANSAPSASPSCNRFSLNYIAGVLLSCQLPYLRCELKEI